jgi:hypothetical protein
MEERYREEIAAASQLLVCAIVEKERDLEAAAMRWTRFPAQCCGKFVV